MAMARLESHVREDLLAASDEVIEDAVTFADPMVLRGLLYQLTGDEEVARARVNPVGSAARGIAGGGDDDAPLLRRKAAEFLKAYRDAGAGEISIGAEERLPTSLRLASNFELADEDMGLYLEELSLDPWARGLQWQTPPPQDRLEAFNVIVIGGGLGGLNAAIQLKRAGIPFTVIEKNADVGGTWCENRYPGCRVDTPEPLLHEPLRRRLQLSVLALPGVRERALLPLGRGHVRAARRHPLRDRSAVDGVGRDHERVAGVHRRPRRRARAARERRHHRRRLPQPSEAARHRRDARLPGAVLPLGALAGRPRGQGQARRRHRHRGQRLPDDPGARPRSRARGHPPAHAAMVHADPGLPNALPAAGQLARPQLALLHQLHAVPSGHVDPVPVGLQRDRPELRRSRRVQRREQGDAATRASRSSSTSWATPSWCAR